MSSEAMDEYYTAERQKLLFMYKDGNPLQAEKVIVLISRAQPSEADPVYGRHECRRFDAGYTTQQQ